MSNGTPSACYPYFQLRRIKAGMQAMAAGATWNVPALCAAYKWPTGLKGGGVIAIVELGGGWNHADMTAFFGGIHQPVPDIVDVPVDGTTNSPGGEADMEVALDIQVAGASYYVATGKPAKIRVYWSQDIATAVQMAAADHCDVCSISWGADEAAWGKPAAAAMEAAAKAATDAGMVVLAAAGDNDSSDGGKNRANVDLPAACPNVIACGGTHKPHAGEETVWNNNPGKTNGEGTGGGFSHDFAPIPGWQTGAPKPPGTRGRMVPDVAANADPETGYEIILDTKPEVVGGTSAVAPLYAGLFAALGTKLGFVNPALWQHKDAFTDIKTGDNGAFHAAVGPDACTGLGAPIGTKLQALFVKAPAMTA